MAPFSYANMIFVAHSLGGVVVRRMLEEHAVDFAGKAIGLVLMASPSKGSAYAQLLWPLARLFGHRTGQDLVSDGRMLEDLDHRFRGLLQAGTIPRLVGIEACEHHGPVAFKWSPWRLKPIVGKASSCCYFGPAIQIANTDHFDIVKPHSAEHQSHKLLANFFERMFAASTVPRDSSQFRNGPTSSLASRVLFDVYNSQVRAYCVRRDADTRFSEALTVKSAWVCGASGLGKTTVVKRYLDIEQHRPIELTLGHLGAGLTEDRLLTELIETINTVEQCHRKVTFADAVDALAEIRLRTSIVLFIDEIPIDDVAVEVQKRLLKFLSTLLEGAAKKASAHIQFVMCSIGVPPLNLGMEKVAEQMQLVPLANWSGEDLRQLRATIEDAIPEIAVTPETAAALMKVARGSPRIVKTYYKRRVAVDRSCEPEATSLEIVALEFGRGAA